MTTPRPQDTDPLRAKGTDREPYAGWALEQPGRTPAGTRVTWFVLGVCVGVLLAVVGMAGIAEARSEPRTAPVLPVSVAVPAPGYGGNSEQAQAAIEAAVRLTAQPTAALAGPLISGIASHMGDSPAAGPGYLALPIGRGHVVRLCGAMGCLTVESNDAGPALFMQRRGRVADLSVELFERLTGLDRSRGLAPISWTLVQ